MYSKTNEIVLKISGHAENNTNCRTVSNQYKYNSCIILFLYQ